VDLDGVFTVWTEYCGVEVEETVTVELDEVSCHAQTQFVTLDVETRGCLATPQDDPPPPRPAAGSDDEAMG
jgi:hypothetical protein